MRALLMFVALPLAAQVYTLGTATDGCVGGTPYAMVGGSTMRYGDFACTFTVPTDGLYQVTLTMQEPCIGVCSPPVTRGGQRSQSVYINDAPALVALDPFAAGGAAPVTRSALAFSAAGAITVRVQTSVRAGVLSSVTIASYGSGAQISRLQCVGAGTVAGMAYDCSGIEFWSVTVGGITRSYAVVSATPEMALPPCPAPGAPACVQPAALGDPPLRATADYNEPPMSINGYAVIPWNSAGMCPWLPLRCSALRRDVCVGAGTDPVTGLPFSCADIEQYTFTLPDGSVRQQWASAVQMPLPACPADTACWMATPIDAP